jgi:hypothetical protein
MWITAAPVLPTEIAPRPRKRLFRGMSMKRDSLSPEKPLFASAEEWEQMSGFGDMTRLAYDHVLADVLNQKQERARSFSLSSKVATCYAMSLATQLYCKAGVVGTFRFPSLRQIVYMGGVAVLYFGRDGTVWLDPRFGGENTEHSITDPVSFEFKRDCARKDAEVLLVHGTIFAEKFRRVRKKPRFRQRFTPWQREMKMLEEAGTGIALPRPRSFDEIEREIKERQRAALVSVLF